MMKLCSCCSKPAAYSVVTVVSTLGISKRVQKCSGAVLFCADCALLLVQHKHSATDKLHVAVNSVFTNVIQQLEERSTAADEQSASAETA